MSNIVLFGGNFDPIHDGHINMALTASIQLDADIVFIPGKTSIWKNDASPIEDRIALIEVALNARVPEPYRKRMSISLYEAEKIEGTNYTIDTVKHFKEVYPEDTLYLLIGTDQVNRFHDWKDALELSKLAHVIYLPRPDYELDENNVKTYHIEALDGEMVDESSTDIKELKSLKMPIEEVEEILNRNMYFTPKLKQYLSDYRFKHSLSVAKTAYQIAMANKVSHIDKIVIACLLHDTAKELKMERTVEIMEKYYPEYIGYHKAMYHQFVGEYIVREEFGINDEEILDAIKYHTTGKSEMTTTGIIVYAADKIEPTRGLFSKCLIEAMCENLTTGFSTVLIDNRKYYIEHLVDYQNPLTLGCMNRYIIE